VNLAEVRRDDRRLVIPPELIADIAAPIMGRPKDEVIGDQLREHRRTMRLARGAVGTLAALTATATVATFIAIGQRNNAQTQARVATSREIAALAIATLGTDTDVAELLAVAAYKMDRNPQTQAALVEAVMASPQLIRYLQTGAAVTCLAAAADGKAVAAGTANGELVLFDLVTGARRAVQAGHGPITDVALSADGSRVAATDGSQAVAWAGGAGRRVVRFGMSRGASGVAVSPSGRLVAVLSNPNMSAGIINSDNASASLLVRDTRTGRQVHAAEPSWVTQVAFSDSSSLILLGEGGSWEQVTAADLREVAGRRGGLTPNVGVFGTSPDASFSGFVARGSLFTWRTTRPPSIFKLNGNPIGPAVYALDLAISPDGKWAATIEGGSIYLDHLTSPSSGQIAESSPAELTSNSNTTLVSFLGDDSHLVSASGRTLVLWNLNQVSRAARLTGVVAPGGGTVGAPPTLAFSPNGQELAVAGGVGGTMVFRVRSGLTRVSETGLGATSACRSGREIQHCSRSSALLASRSPMSAVWS